jgi:hypothetical protein
MLKFGEATTFERPTKATLVFATSEYDINGVVSVLKTEDGTLHITRHDGGFLEVPPGYLFYEFSPID